MQDANKQSAAGLIAKAVAQVLERNSLAALATLVEAPENVGAKLLIEETGERTGRLGNSQLDEAIASYTQTFLDSRAEARTFKIEELSSGDEQAWPGVRVMFERVEPEPRLVICGAGHVGASLARLASFIGYCATLIDDRADFVARERFQNEAIELVFAENWTDAVRARLGSGRGVSVAIVTRGHNEDEECMRAVMSTHPDYVGLIGSKRRTNIVLERLREAGVDEKRLREIRAPIGLNIGAVSPQEVALAILAEIVSGRRGGSCLPLSSWRRK
ncbi:MAG: xanthine dehydrogenase accessory factor [Acidobacteriota bacterium]|jgi:xanthine dehydrogenase accessory factor|nr:xanthine dehydrogenase accessory factor [Acidobacteriota bacterium]